ncbi:aldo/keto reductase [Persicobacter diffluens]|uniref:Glyoxal reductase n=1 Tax=Persicobacter diffluens TaxID=981 RepID=A0AAN4W377_9BACT|nr:glyoxal reductase [Persicobacter diffluens]
MELTNLQGTVKLNNGIVMPYLGLGVFKAKAGDEVYQAVRWALEAGYRHIDTAMIYNNEEDVGRAIADSELSREEFFVTTKLWNDDIRSGKVEEALEASLERLGLDYVDLYLLHWPVKQHFVEAYLQMEHLYLKGQALAIGVSNCHQHHLEAILEVAKVIPAVNQMEYHPYLSLDSLQAFCKSKDIQLEAWAPLMQGGVFQIEVLKGIGEKYRKNIAQIVLRWNLQRGVVTIPKSVHKDRIEGNADIFDFQLSEEDMATINALNKHERIGPDPDDFDF